MKKYEEYFEKTKNLVEKVQDSQGKQIEEAADIISNTIINDGIVHTLGVGHSYLLAEEVFWRAGCPVPIHAIIEPSMMGADAITKSSYMEKLEGTGKIIFDYHRIKEPDSMIIISNSGNNAMPIDVALEAKGCGLHVIGICSKTYSKSLPPRHSSGKKLMDIVDVTIDNCGKIGDTIVNIEGLEQGLGPTSTITGAFIIHGILIQAAKILSDKGIKPMVWWSGNLPNGMEKNKDYVDKYYYRIRNL